MPDPRVDPKLIEAMQYIAESITEIQERLSHQMTLIRRLDRQMNAPKRPKRRAKRTSS